MIIGLGHTAQVGKDTVGDILVVDYGFKKVAFADRLKALALAANPIIHANGHLADIVGTEGWESAKLNWPEVRPFLQRLGEGCRNVFGSGFWVAPALDEALEASRLHGGVVITDMRYLNEAAAIRDLRNGVFRVPSATVKVTRPNVGAANDHVSERDLKCWPFDYTLSNDGTIEDLRVKVAEMIEALG